MKKTQKSLCLLAILLVMGFQIGCGQKGPLYFPEETAEKEQDYHRVRSHPLITLNHGIALRLDRFCRRC